MFIEDLNKVYNQERRESSEKKLSPTSLPITPEVHEILRGLLRKKESQQILDAFQAYANDIVTGEISPDNTLLYFLHDSAKNFPVINRYLEKFNRDFIISKD